MKAVMLITCTDCENKYRSLQAAGFATHVIQYDAVPHERHGEIVEQVRSIAPDFTVFVGAVPEWHHMPVPHPPVLKAIREIAPFIHMCNDAADPPWWPWLQTYHDHGCFDVQVNIDGSHETPLAAYAEGMTALTPTDSRVFHPRPWNERDILFASVGGIGNGIRYELISQMQQEGLLQFFPGPIGRSYDEMAAIMCRSKFIFNCGITGTTKYFHVKGRVIETGLAGAALIEFGPSPTRDWFIPGQEYFSVNSIDEVRSVLQSGAGEAEAAAFHTRVEREHHPRVFWERVLNKVGLNGTNG